MKNTTVLWLLALALGLACGTSSKDTPAGPALSGAGICADECLKACSADGDCDATKGQLCCDFGTDGKACTDAKDCPRFCSSDSKCDSTKGEGCVRVTLESQSSICTEPKDALKICKADADCGDGDVCCSIYKEPVCLSPGKCPHACSTSANCDSQRGEICCSTLKTQDATLAAAGLCVDPATVKCPTACSQSSDCDTKDGEICCQGTCQKSCVKECQASTDCTAQICCLTSAVKSPFVRKAIEPGYAVAMGGGAGSAGAGGSAGGSMDAGGGHGGGGGSSGAGGAVVVDGGGCLTCAQAAMRMEMTDTNVCPGAAKTAFDQLSACVCTGACMTTCANYCQTGVSDPTCLACISAGGCSESFNACLAH